MASARELLEQADALMRKHRERVEVDIPLLVDVVEPAVAATAAPPTLLPAVHADAADFPVLTDIVESPVAAHPAPTDTPALIHASFEGDPSNWLVMDTIDPSQHTVTGWSPDTLGVVPPFTLKAAGSQATPPPARSGPPQGIPGRFADWTTADTFATARVEGADDLSLPSDQNVAFVDDYAAQSSDANRVDDGGQRARETEHVITPAPMGLETQDDAASFDFDPALASYALAEVETDSSLDTVDDTTHEWPLNSGDSEIEIPTVPSDASAELTHRVAEHAAPKHGAVDDDARWTVLAEQISAQVLQRIDMFTDAGLKDQLADKLEPIVARASAELVGTIAEHVGQLLRAYVAEAIEREIATWRREQD